MDAVPPPPAASASAVFLAFLRQGLTAFGGPVAHLGYFRREFVEKRGWLKSEWGVSEANQRAKYYKLTAAGKAQLSREQDRWSQLVDAIGRVMNPAVAHKE